MEKEIMKNKSKNGVKLVVMLTFIAMLLLSGCKTGQIDIETVEHRDTEYDNISSELTEFMAEYNKYCSYKYNGTILVAKGDQILLNEAYGSANIGEDISNNCDSIFPIGSITKSVTAVAIMQLKEKGQLSLDDPISKYIDGNKMGDFITIHHLLTHTSGLGREGKFSQDGYVSLSENVEFINKCRISFEPGEEFLYSNAGYIMLASIIEKVSGQSYEEYVYENIFTPMSMVSSSCGFDNSYLHNQAIGYEILPYSHLKLSIYDFSCITGCGNIYSNTSDLYKYYLGIIGNELVSKETMDTIQFAHSGDSNNGYGYGWEISERYGYKKVSHGGCIGGGGYNSLMIMYPDEEYVLIFLTNNADRTALDAVSQSLEAVLFDENYVVPEKLITESVATETLKTYAGDYQFGENIIITVSYKNGKLFSTADDGRDYELIPISDTEFYYENHQCTRCEFIINEENKEISLVVRSKTYILSGNKK